MPWSSNIQLMTNGKSDHCMHPTIARRVVSLMGEGGDVGKRGDESGAERKGESFVKVHEL